MIIDDRVGKNYSENLLDYYLTFNSSGTWSVVSGTGSGTHSSDYSFQGVNSLKLQNTAPTTNLTVTNSNQNTEISLKTASCGFFFYLRKESPSDSFSGSVEVFKNAVSLGSEDFVLADTQDGEWYKVVSENTYNLVLADVVTFVFTFNGDAGFTGVKTLYIDGMHLYNKERLDLSAPLYQEPLNTDNGFVVVDKLSIDSIDEYADDSAAGVGGLVSGNLYKTSTGELRIKL